MRYLLVLFLSFQLYGVESGKITAKYSVEDVPKKMSVETKKARFFYLLVPPISKVYSELMQEFLEVQADINQKRVTPKILHLKQKYKVESDHDLLLALKPHPKSIALAQAAMESAWATSRFFVEANNAFGMWSVSSQDNRVAAKEKRDGKRTIWLKKYVNLEASVRAYYETMGRAKIYKKFREYRYESDDVFKIIKGLNNYSELGEAYVVAIASMIRYNKLTKYDD